MSTAMYVLVGQTQLNYTLDGKIQNTYVKMLVLLQGNKWVPKYAHK